MRVRIYFNNHARAKSIGNGFLLMDMLLIDHKQKEIKLQTSLHSGSSKTCSEYVGVWEEPTRAKILEQIFWRF